MSKISVKGLNIVHARDEGAKCYYPAYDTGKRCNVGKEDESWLLIWESRLSEPEWIPKSQIQDLTTGRSRKRQTRSSGQRRQEQEQQPLSPRIDKKRKRKTGTNDSQPQDNDSETFDDSESSSQEETTIQRKRTKRNAIDSSDDESDLENDSNYGNRSTVKKKKQLSLEGLNIVHAREEGAKIYYPAFDLGKRRNACRLLKWESRSEPEWIPEAQIQECTTPRKRNSFLPPPCPVLWDNTTTTVMPTNNNNKKNDCDDDEDTNDKKTKSQANGKKQKDNNVPVKINRRSIVPFGKWIPVIINR